MAAEGGCTTTTTAYDRAAKAPPLNTYKLLPLTPFNRVFAVVYLCAILSLFYRHTKTLLHSTTLLSFSITLLLIIADIVLTFMWVNTQCLRMRPITRNEFPENLDKYLGRSEFPNMDVFICTADPYREPPIGVVNTALSVMAYDYPTEKISVYLSDDGGSCLTLFAFMEAAKFARYWLPFCRENNLLDRSPEVYFNSNVDHLSSSESQKIKIMYESMKEKIENVLKRGKVNDHYITGDQERAFSQWTANFTRLEHPAVIKLLLDATEDKDIHGQSLPNLIYVSRQKNKSSPHNFKAGAQNVLLRVSAVMTNSPIILTLDCDMYSNDPRTPLRAICYHCDPAIQSRLAFVQFPQRFRGINKHDIYGSDCPRFWVVQLMGFDGLGGSSFHGTGTFFQRRAFFGGPSEMVSPEIPELGPYHVVDKPIKSSSVLDLAHQVASCTFEKNSNWGSEMGFKYGSLVEDYYTGYRLKCEGWRSAFCNPERKAFYGDAPICFADMLNQQIRWAIGLLEVGFCKYSPLIYGIKHMGIMMGLACSHNSFWALWSIPITTYAFLPQLALLNKLYIFPKVSSPWFFLYIFLFTGAYGQDLLDFILIGKSTFRRWCNDQRIWHIRGVTSYLFGLIDFIRKHLGFSKSGFNVTSKVIDDEQVKRYEEGIFEFGVHLPVFVSMIVAALINLIAFVQGLVDVFGGYSYNKMEEMALQVLIAGFGVANCLPIYEAMVLRSDKGKLPTKTTITATFVVGVIYAVSSFVLK